MTITTIIIKQKKEEDNAQERERMKFIVESFFLGGGLV
jgi:hypothetical protein